MAFPTTIPALARAIQERDYTDPTPVQSAVLEPKAAGRDLLVSAQTGSGKTVAFGLAIAPLLFGDAETLPPAAAPMALIVAPTRELALQVCRELDWLYAGANARVVSCVGGMDPRREQRALASGAHIVVGTPGRLRDHLERGALLVGELKAVVIDEADEMLDLGFRDDLEFILETTPASRRTLLFSATLPKAIVGLAQRYQRDALRLEIAGASRGHADIEYRAVRVMPRETERVVVNLLRYAEAPSALVFCNTRETVRHLHAALTERGFSAVALSGELGQAERNRALQALRDGRARVCVATDVAARGIDLPGLSLVIHADLPTNAETLQHRSGRTGRAGRKGQSVLLVPPSRRRRAEALMAEAGAAPVWSGPPTIEEIRDLDQQRLVNDPLLAEDGSEEDLAMARALLGGRSPEEIATALVRVYRSRLPAAEDVVDPGFQPDMRPPRQGEQTRPARGPHPRDRHPAPHGRGAPVDGPGQWFRLNLGRRQNADPRWLLPMICRRGGVTKQDIGAIRIFDRETKFEVKGEAAQRFANAVRGQGGPDGRIEPLGSGADTTPARSEEGRSPRSGKDDATPRKKRRNA